MGLSNYNKIDNIFDLGYKDGYLRNSIFVM